MSAEPSWVKDAVWSNPFHTVAVFPSIDKVPQTMREPRPDLPPFLHFVEGEGVWTMDELEILPSGLGLAKDDKWKGVVVVAPRFLKPGDSVDEDADIWDVAASKWVEAWDIGDSMPKPWMGRVKIRPRSDVRGVEPETSQEPSV